MGLVAAHRGLGQWQSCAQTAEHALQLLETQQVDPNPYPYPNLTEKADTKTASVLYKS